MNKISPYQLGATIYMPSTRLDLADFIYDQKTPNLKSMVICLEDAILENEIETGLKNIEILLNHKTKNKKKSLVFIRPRNKKIALELYKFKNIELIDGFVLPKFDNTSFEDWLEIINKSKGKFMFMPTLETSEILDINEVIKLKNRILDSNINEKILAIRIGGNDLLSCLKLRRDTESTIYETPLNYIISILVSIFTPSGFYLTAPVYENFGNEEMLKKEFSIDLQYGLIGKTVIHPSQIKHIHEMLKVKKADLESAKLILNKDAKAVFQFNGTMCEPSTHHKWAMEIIKREKYFGSR